MAVKAIVLGSDGAARMIARHNYLADEVLPYIFHADPGHGWLEVPMRALRAFGVAGKISDYSYRKGDIAYLEEDCDAYKFLLARFPEGVAQRVNFTSTGAVSEVYEENTPIRDYPSYWAD